MKTAELLEDGFGRVREVVHAAIDGLSEDQLVHRVDGDGNSIAWLIWHLTRVQDDHLADAGGYGQVWVDEGWFERFALPLEAADTGYGHTPDDVAKVRASAELLGGYHDAVQQRTREYVRTLTDADLDRIVDEAWDPPVSLGVRLISVIDDDAQHAGQASFVRGLL